MEAHRRIIKAAVVSGVIAASGVWLQGCSSGAAASAPDAGAADVGQPTASDGAVDADGNAGESPGDVVVHVTFDLPSKVYGFDSQAWMIPSSNVAVPCGSDADCAAAPVVCEASICTAKISVVVAKDMDLKREVPGLSGLNQTLLGDVSLRQLRFVATSTLNVSLSSLQVYLAPGGTRDPGAPAAQAVGTIPAIPAGSSTSGDVLRQPASDAIFGTYARAFGTPFTFMISATVSVPSGSPRPTGTLTVAISGQASATL